MKNTALLILLLIVSCSPSKSKRNSPDPQISDDNPRTEGETIGEGNQDRTKTKTISLSLKGLAPTLGPILGEARNSEGQNLLNRYCLACHSEFGNASQLQSQEDRIQELLRRIHLTESDADVMPPRNVKLRPKNAEIQLITDWVKNGFPQIPDQTLIKEDQAIAKVSVYDPQDKLIGEYFFNDKQISLDIPSSSRFSVAIRDGVWRTILDRGIPDSLQIELDGSPNLITPGTLNQMINNYGVSSVEEFIDQLPHEYKNNFVLMRESKSRHVATLEHPRIISYGYDARAILGLSTNPLDPKKSEIELAFLGDDGYWQFHLLNFEDKKPQFADATASCSSCHGSPARPIWADYPDWPGAYMDRVPHKVELNAEEAETLKAIKANPSKNPRLAMFPYRVVDDRYLDMDTGINEHDLVLITARINFRQVESIFKRLRRDEEYGKWRRLFLVDQICVNYGETASSKNGRLVAEEYQKRFKDGFLGYYTTPAKLLELMGLDSRVEMALSMPIDEVTNPNDRSFGHQGWFSGEASIPSGLATLMLDELLASDQDISRAFPADIKKRLNEINLYNHETRGKNLRSLFDQTYQVTNGDYYYYYTSKLLERVKAETNLCDTLGASSM